MSEESKESNNRLMVNRKAEQLRAFFPPDVISWEPVASSVLASKPGEPIAHLPVVSATAIRVRLDEIIGPDSWKEAYEEVRDCIRCILCLRFEPGGDWVTRVGLSNKGQVDKAHAEALQSAARSLGIGRYLVSYVMYGEFENGRLKQIPKLPEYALPTEYRKCGQEIGIRLRNLINQACEESVKLGAKVDKKLVATSLAMLYGYHPDSRGEVNLSNLENRYAQMALSRLNDWIAELAAKQPFGKSSLLPKPERAAEEPKQGNTDAKGQDHPQK